jgi:sigma-B regulation protein RsbU (phosphoserine phosphatase)
MRPCNVIVAFLDDHEPSAQLVCQRLTDAWSGAHPIDVTIEDAESLAEAELSGIDAIALVLGDEAQTPHALSILATLEDAGVAVLALLDDPSPADNAHTLAGALTLPADASDARLCATLNGILYRQREVARLRQEVSLAARFQGGLKGEIARMHEELQLAAMVQREFLPRELPTLYGVEFAALWRPAHYVSGDIYDVTRLDDDHVGVFLADAVGHGVPAALMTMIICRSLTTKVITGKNYRIVEPSEVLAQLNRDMIRRQGRTTRFATAAYAVVNCRSRLMRFAGAGHPPPLLLSAGEAPRVLETSGGLLGVFEDETYEQIEVDLAVGDRLLLHSDGFEQAFPTPKADNYEQRLPTARYREEFERLARCGTPQEMIDVIGQRLDDQRGSLHQVDDLTLICMHAGPLVASEAMPGGEEHHGASEPRLRIT